MTRTSASDTGRVTPPKVTDDSIDSFQCDPGALQSFNRSERRELMTKFDAEFTDLLLYVEQTLSGGQVAEGVKFIDKIVTVDGERVMLDDILLEMYAVIRRRSYPETTAEDFYKFSLSDLTGMLQAPKGG